MWLARDYVNVTMFPVVRINPGRRATAART